MRLLRTPDISLPSRRPTPGDAPRPRRRRALLVGVAGLALVALFAACSPQQDHIRDLVNYTRVAKGRSVLMADRGLDDKATYVARSIAAAHALNHSHLGDGVPPGWHKLAENI